MDKSNLNYKIDKYLYRINQNMDEKDVSEYITKVNYYNQLNQEGGSVDKDIEYKIKKYNVRLINAQGTDKEQLYFDFIIHTTTSI